MADKTTGELQAVNVSDLPSAADIYDDFKMPGEFQGDAVHVTGAQMKQYAVASVKPFADAADSDAALAKDAAASAENAKTAAQSALTGVQNAIKNIPAGSTPIVNDLTTGGATSALSAEMGKVLGQRPNPNLLHNWYFLNPVNQKGQMEYSGGTGYTIDRWRWRLQTGAVGTALLHTDEAGVIDSLEIGSSGAISYFVQPFETDLPDGTYTLSLLVNYMTWPVGTEGTGVTAPYAYFALYSKDGYYGAVGNRVDINRPGFYTLTREVSASNNHRSSFRIVVKPGCAIGIVAAKLERSDTQTLAHQDASGQWVLNEIPDYTEELLKCQRYMNVYNLGNRGNYFFAQAINATSARLFVPISQTYYRGVVPSVSFDENVLELLDAASYNASTNSYTKYPIKSMSHYASSSGVTALTITVESGLTPGRVYIVRASVPSGTSSSLILDRNVT